MKDVPSIIDCDPVARHFPSEWRYSAFRLEGTLMPDGTRQYECPLCRRLFNGLQIDELEGHHVWPYSLFGETTWDNYQLICKKCNVEKSNIVEAVVRRELGSKIFRRTVMSYLRAAQVTAQEQKILDNISAGLFDCDV